jgi:hypothetical protein
MRMTTNAPDLRVAAPRRWSDSLEGIRWLPRLIDKTRAQRAGTLGSYLFGQSPVDSEVLSVLGTDYATWARIVAQEPDDAALMVRLRAEFPDGLVRLRRWSDELPVKRRTHMLVLDFDDGYLETPLSRALRLPVRVMFGPLAALLRAAMPVKLDR